MKIKILRATIIGGEHKEAGEIIDFDGDLLPYLLSKKMAEPVVESEKPVKKTAKKE